MHCNILITAWDTKKNTLYLTSMSLYSSGGDKQIASNPGQNRSCKRGRW